MKLISRKRNNVDACCLRAKTSIHPCLKRRTNSTKSPASVARSYSSPHKNNLLGSITLMLECPQNLTFLTNVRLKHPTIYIVNRREVFGYTLQDFIIHVKRSKSLKAVGQKLLRLKMHV